MNLTRAFQNLTNAIELHQQKMVLPRFVWKRLILIPPHLFFIQDTFIEFLLLHSLNYDLADYYNVEIDMRLHLFM